MSDGIHEVLISSAHVAAACSGCEWTSDAVADHAAKIAEADAHMYEHYSVFISSTEDDGTVALCWGTP